MTIDLNLAEEQRQIVGSLREMLADRFPVARLRDTARHTQQDRFALAAVAEFGAIGLARPDEEGGLGLSIVEEVLVHVELGRALVSPGALAAGVAVRIASAAGLPDLADTLSEGSRRACLANAVGALDMDAPEGAALLLFDWQDCDAAVVWTEAGALLLDPRKLEISPCSATDRTVSAGRAVLVGDAVLAGVSAKDVPVARLAQLLVSAQLLGICEATRDMAVDYAKVRTQFGQPIGAFQAVKHHCANMAINAEVLSAQLLFAAIAERDGWEDAPFQSGAACQLAARHAIANASATIQVHGGIGFSDECDAHLFLLRANLLEMIGGPPRRTEAAFLRTPFPQFASSGPDLGAARAFG
ncbi:acyl-CoA dehydrogenase family protein [Amorphus sp. 3PC139-8]|uniref:acyl-CoA dehydrogenase family protein n=1 Tax=Amorphus sp. 3PC139-8 TaxID=2735676 RepID=UPI00345CD800